MTKVELTKMISDGLSISGISNVTGKSKTTVRYWLKKFNLKTQNSVYGKKISYKCRNCGETKKEKMKNCGHGRRSFTICHTCHNKETILRGRDKKVELVEHMGGRCVDCGYEKNYAALEFHHLDSSKKDLDFRNLRYWSIERAKKELQNCILICSNCHRERHNPNFTKN